MAERLLTVRDLNISFKTDNGLVRAVRGVNFELDKGETLCIVGESGSGKSVTSKAIMGILANNAIVDSGEIIYEGENLLEISEEEFHRIRGHKIGMIFQDPLSSLNPIVRIGKQITEATLINGNLLKQKYNELIAKELTAYKNNISKTNFKLLKLERKFKENSDKLFAIIKNKEESLEKRNKAKDDYLKLKESYKVEVAQIKTNFKEKSIPLKLALKARQKEAKLEVKAYAKDLKNKYLEEVNPLNNELKNAKTSKDDAKVKELKDKISLVKETYISKIRVTRKAAKARALEIMKEVGIPLPEKRFKQYPFEFSGGMRQRIVIAIALTATPEILICDEPTTALDVTIQAQILELIKKIQEERHIACIFITHDLGVVANMADRVAVMYAGQIVEYGSVTEIFYEPKHPYTWALLSSIPDVDSKERLDAIPGTPPNMIYPPKGDAFALRSKYAMNIDFEQQPPYFKVSDTHYAATWLLHPKAPKVAMPKIVSQRIYNALKNDESENSKRIIKELLENNTVDTEEEVPSNE